MLSKKIDTECYIWCDCSSLSMPHRTYGRDVLKLMKWIHKESNIKPHRAYPELKSAIIVLENPKDREEVLKLNSKTYIDNTITLREMPDTEYNKTRANVRQAGDKWSWRVYFNDEDNEFKDEENESKSNHVIYNQMYHPTTGHLMCIACMSPLTSGEFNVCISCSSGKITDIWTLNK